MNGQPMAPDQADGQQMSQADMERVNDIDLDRSPDKEPKNVQNARERANTASQPGGSEA